MEKNTFLIQKLRSDGGTLDYGALWNEIALNEGHCAWKGFAGSLDHIPGVNSVQGHELLLVDPASLGLFPPLQVFAQSFPRDGRSLKLQEVVISQMEHDLGHTSSEKNLYRRVAMRPIGKGVHQPGHPLVDALPVFYSGSG